MKPVLMTVRGVELMSTGIEYQLSTGPATFTQEDLAEAVAAVDDPAISYPRLKLGHIDPRFGGEPALGKAVNLRLDETQQTIICDYVGVPRWLGEIMASAYPSRSIEGNFDVETVTGHKWRLVISAVALLGVVWPGISTLADIEALYSEDGPEGVQVIEALEASMGRKVKAEAVIAALSIEDVRRQYYEQLDGSQQWWWIRAMYIDPNELIVDDDEGDLYRVPFTATGETVEFSEAAKVKIEYVAASNGGGDIALVASAGKQAKTYASRPDSRPDANDKEDEDVKIDISKLRARLGLSEEDLPNDATEEQINAVLGQTEEEVIEPEEEDESEEEDETETTTKPETVLVEASALATLQANAQRGAEAMARLEQKDRDQLITAAIKAGKFAPSRREHFAKLYDADQDGTKQLIASMSDNIIPTKERGKSPQTVEAETDAYPSHWLPEVQQRNSANGRVAQEQE